jgi:hypothetical protein
LCTHQSTHHTCTNLHLTKPCCTTCLLWTCSETLFFSQQILGCMVLYAPAPANFLDPRSLARASACQPALPGPWAPAAACLLAHGLLRHLRGSFLGLSLCQTNRVRLVRSVSPRHCCPHVPPPPPLSISPRFRACVPRAASCQPARFKDFCCCTPSISWTESIPISTPLPIRLLSTAVSHGN